MIKLGLLGRHLSHSLSPKIHEFLFEELQIQGKYDLFEKEEKDVNDFIKDISDENIGINVTIPYKIKVIKSLDWISEEASKIGAVNTIHFKNGKKYGYNTDYFGFSRLLEQNSIDVSNKKVVVLGAGGAARAVITCLRDLKAKEIIIVARNLEKATSQLGNLLGEDTRMITFNTLEKENQKGYLVVNSTPVGMFPNIYDCPISEKSIRNYEVFVDLIYNPLETKFLEKARLCGKKAVNGMFMLVAQGIASEEIWLNKKIGNDVIEKIAKRLENNKNIVLIGMPGCGKTYIGKILAEKLNKEFIDSDEYLQTLEKKSISELFVYGEEYFREVETKAIKEISLNKNKVISTGGGVIKKYENIELLKKNGIIIFLNRPLERIIEDIDVSSRPLLLKGIEEIYSIYNKRVEFYKKYSDYIIENKTGINQVVDSIIDIIQK